MTTVGRHDKIRVTLLDTVTGRTADDDEHALYGWQEGNQSCDCNRRLPFDVSDPNEDPDTGISVCMGCERFLVVAADGASLAEFNWGYPADLVRRFVAVPPAEWGERDGRFCHKDLA